MADTIHREIEQNLSLRTQCVILLCSSLLLLFIGWLDIITGDYSLIVFYLIPISIVAWFVGNRSGVLFCLLAIIVRVIADEWTSPPNITHSVLHYWNETVELLFLIIMSLLFSALKKNLDNKKELSRRDPLTGALTRRSFFDLAEHEIKRAHRYDLPLTMAYINLDDFKIVNDRLGHRVGDELLISVVSTIRPHIRNMDILARFGGDEFVILLPNTPGDAAIKILNMVHENLDQVMVCKNWPVGFSVGAASYDHAPLTIEEVIRNADELMYTAKRGGKNRLIHKEIGEVTHG